MENQNKLRPLRVNAAITSYTPISRNLRKHKDLTALQKLFLMEVLEFQVMGGQMPYVSVRCFASEFGWSEKTIRTHIKDLVEKGRLLKFEQKRKDIPCDYLITTEFLEELGYVPLSRDLSSEVEESKEVVEDKEVLPQKRDFNAFANPINELGGMNKEAAKELKQWIRSKGEAPF